MVFFAIIRRIRLKFSKKTTVSVSQLSVPEPPKSEMPINILNFPYVVQKEILEEVRYSDIIFLSLCSSAIKKSIQYSSWNVLKIRYTVNKNDYSFVIEQHNKKQSLFFSMENVKEFTGGEKTEKLTIGVEGSLQLSTYQNDSLIKIKYLGSLSRDEVRELLISHIRSLFRCTSLVEIELTSDDVVYKFPKIKGVKNSILKSYRVDLCILDDFFELYPNQNSSIINSCLLGRPKKNSKLFEVNTLYFKNSDWVTESILLRFKGRHLSFENAKCDDFMIIQFLNKWISNDEIYEKLETVEIDLEITNGIDRHTKFDSMKILNEFETKPWDPDRRSKDYKYDPRLIDETDKRVFNCADDLDIQRKCDGKMASIYISPHRFRFCVWK